MAAEDVHSCADTWLTDKAKENSSEDNPRWIECASGKQINKTFSFNGDDALLLYDGSSFIDCFGAASKDVKSLSTKNCRNEESWKESKIRNMDYGKTAADFDVDPSNPLYGINLTEDSIELCTARSILFRDSLVTSGDEAVLKNTETFATFAKEWRGRNICGSGTTGN